MLGPQAQGGCDVLYGGEHISEKASFRHESWCCCREFNVGESTRALNWVSLFFFFLFTYLFLYFWLHWVFIAVRGLSLVAASRGYSSLQCTGLSLAV